MKINLKNKYQILHFSGENLEDPCEKYSVTARRKDTTQHDVRWQSGSEQCGSFYISFSFFLRSFWTETDGQMWDVSDG